MQVARVFCRCLGCSPGVEIPCLFPLHDYLSTSRRNADWSRFDIVIYLDPYTSRSYTFASTKSSAIAFGQGLKAIYDWRKGDVLAIFSPNSIDFPVITWGCLWAGGVVSPANPGYTAEELAFQLKDSGARAIVTQWPFVEVAKRAARIAGLDENNIMLMGDERDPSGRAKHFTSIRNTSGATRYRKAKINPSEDLSFLVYSSGTTGHPKGVMLTHTNIASNVLQVVAGEAENLSVTGGPDGQGDKILAFLPFFHIYGTFSLSAVECNRDEIRKNAPRMGRWWTQIELGVD